MKLSISLEVESQQEANEVLAALVKISNLPYRLSVFGVGHPVDPAKAVVTEVIDPKYIKHPPEVLSDLRMASKLDENNAEQPTSDPIQTSPHASTSRPPPAFSLYNEDDDPAITPQLRDNVEPPGNCATKLFASTRAKIIEGLSGPRPQQPHKDYAEAAKLLWTRGEVGFDGGKFYL
jgi:hypothetical protein